jgi:hypothetical protein
MIWDFIIVMAIDSGGGFFDSTSMAVINVPRERI